MMFLPLKNQPSQVAHQLTPRPVYCVFAGDIQLARAGADGDDHRVGEIFAVLRLDVKRRAFAEIDFGHEIVVELRAEALRLLLHPPGEFRSGDAVREAGEVIHVMRRGDLPAKLAAGHDDGAQLRAGGVERGGQPGRT